MYTLPSSEMAPIASSGCPGARSLRDRTTSRSAPSSRANTAPVTIPPRGIASTKGSCSFRPFSSLANREAASSRSRNMAVSFPLTLRPELFQPQVQPAERGAYHGHLALLGQVNGDLFHMGDEFL